MRRTKLLTSNLTKHLQPHLEAVREWIVAHILWPFGIITYGLTFLVFILSVLTLVLGAFSILAVTLFAPQQQAAFLEIYGMMLAGELLLSLSCLVISMRICEYFDHRNGLY